MDVQIKTIFGTGATLGPEDFKKSKKIQEFFCGKKLEGLENHYIRYLMGLCSSVI